MSLLFAQDIDVIADHISPRQQGWLRELTVRSGLDGDQYKLRVRIDRDSYDFQSRIGVDVWSPAELKWNNLRTLSGSDHGDLPSSSLLSPRNGADYVLAGKAKIYEDTAELVDELLGYAQQVLA